MKAARASRWSIETPEGVVFSYDLATPAARSLAWAVDTAVVAGASYMLGRTCTALNLLNPDWAEALAAILYFAISVVYAILLEWRWHGQTLGKRLMGLRVIDVQGLRLQLPQIALRNLLRLVDALPAFYLVGGIACLLSRNAQRLGDLAANTIVARERRPEPPDLEQLAPAKYNSLAAYPHLAARLRSLVTASAAAIAVRAVALRDSYDPAARVALFHELAAHFRSLVEFPEGALEGLSDEQYVRSVLRVIYGAAPAKPSGCAT